MKNNKIKTLFYLIIIMAIFVIYAIFPFVKNIVFWLALAFGIVSILLYTVTLLLSKDCEEEIGIYRISIAKVISVYLAAQLCLSTMQMLFSMYFYIWLALGLNVIMLTVCLVGCVPWRKLKLANKKQFIIVPALIVCALVIIALYKFLSPYIKYNRALSLMNNGDYEAAYEAFGAMKGYKDSENLQQTVYLENEYNKALDLMNSSEFDAAYDALVALNGYRDSKTLLEKCNRDLLLKSATIGDIVTFGNYKGCTEWIVLDKEDEKLLLISKYAIEKMPFEDSEDDGKDEEILWEDCSLREWLNSEYIDTAFNSSEQNLILYSTLKNYINLEDADGADSGIYTPDMTNDTTDRVFLLSVDEAWAYFESDEARATTMLNGDAAYWWLRNPKAYVQSIHGCVFITGLDPRSAHAAVRPAMWVDISKL